MYLNTQCTYRRIVTCLIYTYIISLSPCLYLSLCLRTYTIIYIFIYIHILYAQYILYTLSICRPYVHTCACMPLIGGSQVGVAMLWFEEGGNTFEPPRIVPRSLLPGKVHLTWRASDLPRCWVIVDAPTQFMFVISRSAHQELKKIHDPKGLL